MIPFRLYDKVSMQSIKKRPYLYWSVGLPVKMRFFKDVKNAILKGNE